LASLTPTPYATQIANPANGGNAKYSLAGLTKLGNNLYTDGYYTYNDSGLANNRPDSYVSGLPPANASESYNVATGQYSAGGPLGGGGGGGSFGPEFDQMMKELNAQSVADKSSRDAAIKRSYINFGLPNFDLAGAAKVTGIGDLASILDPQTLELAKNNKFSVEQRLEQALADRKQSDRVQLRQRGAVRSGESGYLGQRSQNAFDTDVYDSTQKLLDYISGAQAGFAQAEQARKMQAWQLALAAAARGGYGGYGGDGGGPVPPAAPTANLGPPPPSPFIHAGLGVQTGVNPQTGGGYAINTGGGYYTNRQNDLTSKWQRLAGLS